MALKEVSLLAMSLLCVGLITLFSGERAFAHTSATGFLSWLGILMVAASIALRGWASMRSKGAERKIEMVLSACSAGVVISLLGYYLTTQSGMGLLGIEADATVTRWKMVMTVLWLIALLVSMLPMILITVVRSGGRSDSESSVDLMQVKEGASSGLSIALAASFLMVTCNIADQRNIRKDVSYFKTSDPGTATVSMLNSLNEPLRVLAFFPEDNEVSVEVQQYFDSLASKTKNLEFALHDRLLKSGLAKEHKVSRDGTIVLLRGDASKKFTVSTDYNLARSKALREFDGEFQKSLMGVLRDTKTAYFLVGHGELNDPGSTGALGAQGPPLKATLIKAALKQLNYKTKDYEGFGKPVPDDCSVLLVLAPQMALMDDELLAIDDYLAQGGSAIFAFDPDAKMSLGLLQRRLGVAFNPTPITDDKEFMVQSRTPADHALILTNQFLSHASISTMSRGNARAAILFVRPGSFDDLELTEDLKSTKKSQIIRSMPTAFRDLPGSDETPNFLFDEKSEKRDRYTMAMAVENPDAQPSNLPEGVTHEGMRVVLLADREVLTDGILARVAVAQNMLVDIIKWTGGEEAFAGKTNSEKDKRIEHSKSQDAKWFYGTILGAPLLVLLLGFAYLGRRGRGRRRLTKDDLRSSDLAKQALAKQALAKQAAAEKLASTENRAEASNVEGSDSDVNDTRESASEGSDSDANDSKESASDANDTKESASEGSDSDANDSKESASEDSDSEDSEDSDSEEKP